MFYNQTAATWSVHIAVHLSKLKSIFLYIDVQTAFFQASVDGDFMDKSKYICSLIPKLTAIADLKIYWDVSVILFFFAYVTSPALSVFAWCNINLKGGEKMQH